MKKYLIFALIGYAIGTLYAPKKGSLLRKEIKDCFSDVQKQGKDTLQGAQCECRKIVEKTSFALTQAKKDARTLKCEGEEMVRIASLNLQQAYDRTQNALRLAQERVASKEARRLVG